MLLRNKSQLNHKKQNVDQLSTSFLDLVKVLQYVYTENMKKQQYKH